ncbi:MAG: chromosomal replication initiator protein DnaA [bacterium]
MQTKQVNTQEWQDCLQYISRRTKEQAFSTWLKPTSGRPASDGSFEVVVPNQFVADWIGQHFGTLINEAFHEVLGRDYDVSYVINSIPIEETQTSLDFQSLPPSSAENHSSGGDHRQSNLNQRYNFDSLVVGDFNQFVCAASMAVAEAPGTTRYNPLFIYGGTGLGKTHIAQAIGHRILELFPGKRVLYATSETFTSDFISSISEGSIAEFTRKYRDVDVLVIDDIQFFSGKESTQEQFFHTFNTLHHFGKQIVLSSDRPPREIKGLEERLLSRFSSGLVTDLQAPDLENRTAIIYKKLESEGASLPDDVARYIASKVTTNIRELEGTLIRLLAYASLQKVSVDLELAKRVLSDSIAPSRKDITIEAIQKKTAEWFKIEVLMMKAKKKTAHIAAARQVAMYLARSLTDNSLKAIGADFGGRDHSTVIHACDTVSRRMAEDPGFREKIDRLSAALLY